MWKQLLIMLLISETVKPQKENPWVSVGQKLPLPAFSVVGGYDVDGTPLYVGRTYLRDQNLPAKIGVKSGLAYAPLDGAEHSTAQYDVLVGKGYIWVPGVGGKVPQNAVYSGNTTSGEPLYIGRGHYENTLAVGKYNPSHGCLYLPHNAQEIRITHFFEVLVQEDFEQLHSATPYSIPPSIVSLGSSLDYAPFNMGTEMQTENVWVSSSTLMPIPAFAVQGGYDYDGVPIYVGRAYHEGQCLPAKVGKGFAFVASNGAEYRKSNFEVLVSRDYSWVPCSNGSVPQKAVCTGKSSSGDAIFVGRGYHANGLCVGMVIPSKGTLYIPFGGQEHSIQIYEVLVMN